MKLTKEIVKETKDIETPFLFIDLDILKNKYQEMKKCLKNIDIYYAIKANSDQNVIKTLHSLGSKFETASLNEILLLKKLGVKPENIINSAPFRKEINIKKMYDEGIRLFCYDTHSEAEKFKRVAPEAKLFLRIHVENQGSDWPMPKKFGAEPSKAFDIIKRTIELGLEVIGVTFHPGSQCLSVSNWINSLMFVSNIFSECKKEGIELSVINLGGGIPIQHTKDIPTIKEIYQTMYDYISENFSPMPTLMIEPGRGIVGDCAIMVTEVISKREFKGEEWIYLDIGVFHGMMETICDFDYELLTEKDLSPEREDKQTYVIAGPSCDGVDIMFKEKEMTTVEIGDRVYIINAGAYTLSYASLFNGLKVPKVYYKKNGNNAELKPSCMVETYYSL